ncbi:MAG: glycoside hydrolase [Gemmatimonadetes bacterium]|nr:glycoside hydrolase [Gemmatimonadota bacterium]
MRLARSLPLVLAALAGAAPSARAQSLDPASAMHWRSIGPTRAGRARALAGVPSQPNVFYIGFDDGGVWRSTDYGSTWVPLFDKEKTGSIGAIAVAPSDPNVIYVGTGAGIIRPDLATGHGVYKSTDAGKTWTPVGLFDSQMIAMIDVDPRNPDRVFVAALGHPYGPNEERGVFRSLDGGRSWTKVLYRDEYTSANDVRIDPSDPNTVYATLWQQQQAFWEGGGFGGGGNGIFKSVDGGASWSPVSTGLPTVLQANIALAPSNPKRLYAMVASATPTGQSGPVGFYTSPDGGAHWTMLTAANAQAAGNSGAWIDARPLGRIGGGDLPTLAIDPKNENVVYSSSTVFWRTEDAGKSWSAVRGAPGGDDYQKAWINPNNPDIILSVSDQGGVVSANRGASWSNWYTQPTAAMYHVTTDFNFPYRVCSGQQDSGSACVDSRSNDGEITFHDWHPVNIQEYGIAAPDPKDADMVYGSMRSGVSLFNRRTGQTTFVGPDMTATGPKGERYNRNVRTMPILFSPIDHQTMYYASNAVWKSTDKGATWARISGDLARQAWTPPASAGKYASTVTPSPIGAITALALTPKDGKVIWAGTDDGLIQVTTDGGAHWKDVTPNAIKPWTRIYNLEAGHHDAKTAYAAANTIRIDDRTPRFWRTHDGGATWTEISTGLSAGAAANTIREDPRVPGLLYAGTDAQVWVSYDDGDHWQSLRLDMPAIAIRDLQVKDDSTCLCADLVAGTHGRGFWILDNLTPLRQRALLLAAERAQRPALVKPLVAVRVRHGGNEPTPWPPEVPAGENPPPGALIDYYLPGNARVVTIDILDASGKVVRSHASTEPRLDPDPGVDLTGYDTRVCRVKPTATGCGLPLYWLAPQMLVSAGAGMHRFSWDMRLTPLPIADVNDQGDEDANGAVPHHTWQPANAPWAPPGRYTVRITVDGTSVTQPLDLTLDPRVKTPAAALARLNALTRQAYDAAVSTHAAFTQARGLSAALARAGGADADQLRAQIDSIAPADQRSGRARRRGGPPALNLEAASNALMAAAMAMQGAEMAPTAAQAAAVTRAKAQADEVLGKWRALSGAGLTALNAKRKAAGQAAIELPGA